MLQIIANPHSGGGNGQEYLALVQAELLDKGIPHTVHKTQSIGHGKQLAEELTKQGAKKLIVIGGDGTINEVVDGIGDMEVSLGIIASGTGNDFIRSTHLPKDPLLALDIILQGHVEYIDTWDINGRRFLNVAGTGFDVDLSFMALKLKKYIKGAMNYYIALAITLFKFPFREMTITIDNSHTYTTKTMLIAAANGSRYGGGMPIAPKASITDGLLDVIVIRQVPRYKIPYLLVCFLKGTHITKTQYVDSYKCSELSVAMKEHLTLNIDGEMSSNAPFTVTFARKLPIYMPKE